MTTYRLKNSAVQAIQYTGQDLSALPDFVKNFSAFSPLSGTSQIGRNLVGALLVPHAGGYFTATKGDWLILTGKNMSVLTDKSFTEHYEADVGDTVTITAQVGSPLAEAAKTLEPVGPAPVVAAPAPVAVAPAPTTAAPVVEAPAPTAAAPVIEPAPTAAAPVVEKTETVSDASKS